MSDISPLRKKYRRLKESFYDWRVGQRLSLPNKENRIVIFYPQMPRERHVFARMFKILGYKIINDLRRAKNAATIVFWEDKTFATAYPEIQTLSEDRQIVNIHCKDISKKHVDEVFGKVFGYKTIIDPITFKGTCVKKGDVNAAHDGTIVECPVNNPEPGFIYQKLINNKVNDQFIEDIRVPVFGNEIPFVYVKHRPIGTRFGSINNSVVVAETKEIFNEQEISNIMTVCNLMGLDYGELDILRDRDNGRIYIVDVNNTPGGPPNKLSVSDQLMVLERLSKACYKNFIQEKEVKRGRKLAEEAA